MSRKIKGNGKHLTFSDRVYIEQELMQGSSFRDIAAGLGKDPSTISKEIRLHCAVAPNGTYRFPHCTACSKYKTCKDIVYLCSTCKEYLCWRCSANRDLSRNCKDYNPFTCPKLAIPKGRSMYRYTQEDINLMASHINSTARDSLNGATPFDLAELLIDKKIPLLAGQHKVSPDSVMLKPVLIERSVKEREANNGK